MRLHRSLRVAQNTTGKAEAALRRFGNRRQISSIRSSPRVAVIIIGRLEFAYSARYVSSFAGAPRGTLPPPPPTHPIITIFRPILTCVCVCVCVVNGGLCRCVGGRTLALLSRLGDLAAALPVLWVWPRNFRFFWVYRCHLTILSNLPKRIISFPSDAVAHLQQWLAMFSFRLDFSRKNLTTNFWI